MHETDLAVIGSGPAGMAAAAEAAGLGLRVALFDDQPRPGGQAYRDVDRVGPMRGAVLGPDFVEGRRLTAALDDPRISHLGGAGVWAIEPGFTICYSQAGEARLLRARRVLLATGALERPMPVPGWTLPGVMTAGAGQILLKQAGLVPRRSVLVGTGPLLYLFAVQMVRAGINPAALIETQTRGDLARALRHMGGLFGGWGYMTEGWRLLRVLQRAGVPRIVGAHEIAIEGEDRAEAVRFRRGGAQHRLPCDTVFLHHGVVPNPQAARSLGLDHRWEPRQQCFVPVCDAWGEAASAEGGVEGVFVAGDGAGIGGARAAELQGRLAALRIAAGLDRIGSEECDGRAKPLRRQLRRELAVRPFLDAAYPPFAEALRPDDTTMVCRCEEVTAGEIRRAAAQGCPGPNRLKGFLRAGMGPCQGRVCGLAVTQILAEATGQSPDETGYFHIRPPIKPLTLGALAALAETGEAAGTDKTAPGQGDAA
ncbi:FAD/NAD(P)-binding oxidoreductase [Rhodovulum viride]|uniref:FAD/NAD(P)-binding oxidoreductase n=1 Tax=Rhodovulum viride TaxID=1231134 RepID=A0ABX9DMN5_9RHOB|nr:NAD(P)/FAD-dependent oxidoreductase [Rhodovulum viride]RAP42558.1 FAD/NAD(P)-binding oxidoreductase [Rhodovulum viride]